ncbi:P-loop containing nucleoside triphosphate hydrolase protein [Ascobolus immersus RN42]|uniref:RNA helicase n=1 Tax=Ascobolus immersus RN42 TaxID=1160509 RepID=A0A3N4HRJ3_ASCIM|nr:P-loop containing nucleoside triphosphate hydrolase protein [Ascobolus immersus RN42]
MADIFRLLSRSTKLKAPTKETHTSAFAATVSVPTTSTTTAEASKASKKRKRKAAKAKAEEDAAVPAELDFFGMAAAAAKKEKAEAGNKKRRVDNEDSEDDGSDVDVEVSSDEEEEEEEEPVVELTEEEGKKVLRENKLKIAQLHPLPAAPSAVESKDKKKKKKGKKEEEEKKVQHKPVPLSIEPLVAFEDLKRKFPVGRRLFANVMGRNFAGPTQVQMAALPILLAPEKLSGGEDLPKEEGPVSLLVCAPTGSGKTLAFALPLLSQLLKEKKEGSVKVGPKALILAPTKELAGQIVNELRRFGLGTGIRATLVKKGVDVRKVKSEILVGTPGVVLRSLQPEGDKKKKKVVKPETEGSDEESDEEETPEEIKLDGIPTLHTLILDEADVLLDDMFRSQTLSIWRSHTPTRVSLWSATIPSSTESLAKSLILTSSPSSRILRLTAGIQATSLPPITHTLTYCATEKGKLLALRQLLSSPTGFPTPALIFTQTVPRATALHSELLYDLPQQGRIAVLHSKLSEAKREQVMTRFRSGETWLLITTDLLSRGIDFSGVKLVVNYDIPTSVASFIHRVGRTSRSSSSTKGQSITLYTKPDIDVLHGIAAVISRAEDEAGKTEDEKSVKGWLLAALPKVEKRTRKEVAKRGVKGRAEAKITTRPGWERKHENRVQGAKEASRRRKEQGEGSGEESGEDIAFSAEESE